MKKTKPSPQCVSLPEPFKRWKRADLHVHTWHSEDVMPMPEVSPLALYNRALERGMDFVTFTDHDTMNAYNEIGWSRDRLVTGVEVKLLDPVNIGHTLHINVYTLNLGQFQEIQTICNKGKRLEILIEYLRAEGLPYTYNHPFWAESGEELNIQSVFDIAPLFPVLEYNKGRVARLNQQAVRLAHSLGKGLVANTDTHSGHVGEAFTAAPGNCFEEYFSSLIKGESVMHHVDMTQSSFTWELRYRIHHLFNRSGWAYEKPDFNLSTGIERVDRLIGEISTRSRMENSPRFRLLGKGLDMVALSRIPALIFIKGQQTLGKGIEARMSGLGS
jgi:predicted metal-dependent phosphoesterase TrpH